MTVDQRDGRSTSGYLRSVDIPRVPAPRINGRETSQEVNKEPHIPKQIDGVVQVGILQQAGATTQEKPASTAAHIDEVNTVEGLGAIGV